MQHLELLVRTLHHLTKHFKEHAVLKGGIELALFSSARSTNDLDFVFVPYQSKKDIVEEVKICLESMSADTKVQTQLTSKNAKFFVKKDGLEIEVEINVSMQVESIPMNTAVLAKPFHLPPQVIRVMKPEVALAHKIAAWNERRLIRDIYDIYFWFSVQNVLPDMKVLAERLKKIESRVPELKKYKSMTLQELCEELKNFCKDLNQKQIDQELVGLPINERRELHMLLRSQINFLIQKILIY